MVASEAAVAADSASMLTQSELDTVTVSAMTEWIDRLGDGDPRLAGFGNFQLAVADLGGLALGYTEGRHVWIDSNAAGYGWSQGGMDLRTVVTHELGHVLGFDHDDAALHTVMRDELDSGGHFQLGGFDAFPASTGHGWQLEQRTASFDFGEAGGNPGAIDWNARAGDGWGVRLSPYAAPGPVKEASNFSDFLVNLFRSDRQPGDGGQAGYDQLGASLLGSGKQSKSSRKPV
jgi:hypothetical protein